jgi:hypothetical protein
MIKISEGDSDRAGGFGCGPHERKKEIMGHIPNEKRRLPPYCNEISATSDILIGAVYEMACSDAPMWDRLCTAYGELSRLPVDDLPDPIGNKVRQLRGRMQGAGGPGDLEKTLRALSDTEAQSVARAVVALSSEVLDAFRDVNEQRVRDNEALEAMAAAPAVAAEAK